MYGLAMWYRNEVGSKKRYMWFCRAIIGVDEPSRGKPVLSSCPTHIQYKVYSPCAEVLD